jgi:hypothetical protein
VTENTQSETVLEVLSRFQKAGVLQRLILIGSWCLHFYRYGVCGLEGLRMSRTTDIDFLVPRPFRSGQKADIPAILQELGFVSTFHGQSGLAVYDHPELRLEFLIPELGKGSSGPVTIRDFHIKAQEIRYLNFLADHPIKIEYQGLIVTVPEPAIFALHKLIVSSRRKKPEKREKDLVAAVGILEFLFKDPKEKARVGEVLSGIPSKWRKTILTVSAKHFPALNEL